MPMADVYSSMAKGVIDGVIAPTDALRSMHLAEVARYYAQLAIPRGAYPSRAISAQALARLPGDLQSILLASGPVWEAALAREVGAAMQGGRAYAVEHEMRFTTLADSEQRAFADLYNAAALDSARQLARRGIDGEAMFKRAQTFIRSLRDPVLPLTAAVCPAGYTETPGARYIARSATGLRCVLTAHAHAPRDSVPAASRRRLA
jgi:hypothetical protein